MSLLDRIVNGIASMFNSEPAAHKPAARKPAPGPVPLATLIFETLVPRLATHFDARVEWDADGHTGAGLLVHIRGDARTVILMLTGDILCIATPSNVKFPPGGLPGPMTSCLAERNRTTLDFAQWDAVDNERVSYFTLKAQGNLTQIGLKALQDVVERMLTESYAFDQVLEKQGFVR